MRSRPPRSHTPLAVRFSWCPQTSWSDSVARELERLAVEEVVIMGGPEAISPTVEQQLGDYRLRRVAGRDRFETSVEVARLLPPSRVHRVYLAAAGPDGLSYPDAMAVAPVAASEGNPVVLVERDRVPEPVRAVIYDRDSRADLTGVIAVGGPDAISGAVLEDLDRHEGYDGDYLVSRIAGGKPLRDRRCGLRRGGQ